MAFIPAVGSAILGGGAAAAAAGTVGTAIVGGLAVGGAAVGIANTVKSVKATKAAAQATQQAAQTQVRIQQQQVAQQRRQSIRRSIIARSQLRQRAQAAGLGGSSAVGGGIGSISSQLGTNLGFGSMMSGLSGAYTALTGRANYLQSQSQMFGTIAGLGFSAAQAGIQYAPQIGGFFGGFGGGGMGGGQPPIYDYDQMGPQ